MASSRTGMPLPVKARRKSVLGIPVSQGGTLIGFFVLCAFFAALSPYFLTFTNLITVMRQISILAIVAIGITTVMGVGEFDLSPGQFVGLIGVALAGVLKAGGGVAGAVAVALVIGIFLGLINGALVAYIGVPAFIATLATGTIAVGVNFLYTRGYPIFEGITSSYRWLAEGYVGPVPVPVVILLLVVGTFYFLLNHTALGRHIYATGGNREASMLSGINTRRMIALAFTLTALTCAVSAIIMVARLGSGQPTAGPELTLDGYAAVFLGTSTTQEGEFSVLGTFLGALIIGVLTNGLTLLNVPYYFQNIAKGLVLIGAVTAFAIQKSRRK